jgi:hypothetical protein
VTALDIYRGSIGIWRVTWAGKDYLSYFRPNGQVEFYDYEVPSLWVGRWRVERGVLHIEDCAWRKGLPGGMPRKWSGKLEPDRWGFRGKDSSTTLMIRVARKKMRYNIAEWQRRKGLRP